MLETLLQIVLWILSFIGITLLVVLGLILIVLLFVLFVPIRYSGEFQKNAEVMKLQIKANWLLHLVRVRAEYEKEFLVRAFVLFFKVYDSSKPPKEKKVKEKRSKEKHVKEKKLEQENIPEAKDEVKKETLQGAISDPTPEQEVNETEEIKESEDVNQTDVKEKKPFFVRMKEKIENIICKIKSICDKIKDVVQNIQYYLEILQEEETKALFGRCKTRIFKVLKSIRPRKLKVDAIIGTGSPDTTGYLMAIAGMLYPYFGSSVNIVPDFEKTIFEGQIFIKGRITVFVIVLQALKLLLDKELRNLLKRLKREDA